MVSAISDMLSMERPSRYITAKVAMMETGTATAGISVARRRRMNRKITITTRPIVSISVNCTSLTAARMERAGIENVAILPSERHPAVYGEWLHAPGKPTILIYGHYDVMPPGPLHLWTTPPFAPDRRNGRLYGRGASDDKGNMLIPILAAEALLSTRPLARSTWRLAHSSLG